MKTFEKLGDSQLIELLQSGAVGVLPTDTVYGLVCCAANQAAVARLYALKHREHKPGTIIAANIDQLVSLGIKPRYLKAVEQFWPASLSVIIPCGDELSYLHQGVHSAAVRIPQDATIRGLLEMTGPLLTTSANLPGVPVAATVAEARAYFGDSVDFYVDVGSTADHKPSTIIRIVDDAIEIIRQGAVTIDESGRIAA